jgi:penicillin-binding protein 2
MQLAHAIAIVANNGVAFRPHLVKNLVNLKSGEERSVAPEPTHTISSKPEHIAFVRNALVGVNKEGMESARAFWRGIHVRRQDGDGAGVFAQG